MYRYHPFYPPVQRPYSPIHSRAQPFPSHHRNYPPVETKTFMSSAGKTLNLLGDAQKVLQKINTSKDFSSKFMNAAQQSNVPEVHKLLQTIGTRVQPIVSFNPDGVRLVFDEKLGQVDCCHLIVIIRWM
ncbi:MULTISPECIES: hypothetical protein [Rossellomorea]|jgi:hypothetical protein|uniref:Uncharacterized protein n=1 Tax=Rossellomorea vietnamensis TaxID=218284 RepID=A0A6I6UJ37_9BACI|nr:MULTISPECIES: hypothetical protein [Rossellomorea]MCA0150822.1 hypothetical protein [Rossellomorea vietnamensis]QHE62954.1 hypothetical protein FHE72_19550 [Rossellomorea vietnamensis]UTE77067.1 hypothetical protein M1J35_21525 [Rossellomorea sp. KS-H15a]WGG44983.1 hypothetical protein P8596_19925 [Rossellomorea sp. DA94]